MAPVAEGDLAPDFTLPTDGGGEVSLRALAGKGTVVWFYPKDDTSGCTREALDFSALAPEFRKIDVNLIAISPDSVKSHDKFRARHDLAVPLASDESKATLEAYGVWVEKSMYGRTYMGVERSTFLIDGDGRIVKAWRKVKVPGHAQEVLAAAQAL